MDDTPFEPEQLPLPVIVPDAPCDFGHCLKPWSRRVDGRYLCGHHATEWALGAEFKEIQ